MAIFIKNRLINWGVFVLVLVNIGMLVTLGMMLLRQTPAPAPAQRFLQDELHLTDAQIQQIEELKRLYQGKMNILDAQAKTLKEAMLEEVFASAPDMEKASQLADGIGATQAELERLRFQHFLELKTLFEPEQTEKFQALIRDIFRPPAPPGSERPSEQSRSSRLDEQGGKKRPPERREPPEHKRPPERRKPPRPDEPPGEPRPEG